MVIVLSPGSGVGAGVGSGATGAFALMVPLLLPPQPTRPKLAVIASSINRFDLFIFISLSL
jgi:hypothetical protein